LDLFKKKRKFEQSLHLLHIVFVSCHVRAKGNSWQGNEILFLFFCQKEEEEEKTFVSGSFLYFLVYLKKSLGSPTC
jgi:hypothetical protein